MVLTITKKIEKQRLIVIPDPRGAFGKVSVYFGETGS